MMQVFLRKGIVLLAIGLLTACSNSDGQSVVFEKQSDEEGEGLQAVKDIKGYDTISVFFNSELPIDEKSAGFFVNNLSDECYCINTLEELKKMYSGDHQIPEIDFKNYTLIIGQHIMPCSGYMIEKQEIVLRDNNPVLNLTVHNKYEYKPALLTPLYFWGVYTKLYKSNVDVNLIIL